MQSSILSQSQCNHYTDVPEYIELGEQPGTSVDQLHQGCVVIRDCAKEASSQNKSLPEVLRHPNKIPDKNSNART